MSTAALIRSQIEQFDASSEEDNTLDDKSKTDFGNVQFGARNTKAWSFSEIEDLENSNPFISEFSHSLNTIYGGEWFKITKR